MYGKISVEFPTGKTNGRSTGQVLGGTPLNRTPIRSAHADTACGGAIFLAAAVMFVHTFSDRYDIGMLFGDVSTVFFPRIILGLIMLLAAALAGKGLRAGANRVLVTVDLRRTALAFLIAAATTAGMWWLGFLLATPFGLIALGLVLGYRKPLPLLAVSIAGPAIVWIVLVFGANVSVPAGILG